MVPRTTARFIRFGPAPTAPRSPAVPNSSRPGEPVGQFRLRLRAAGAGQGLELGPVPFVGVLGEPGFSRARRSSLIMLSPSRAGRGQDRRQQRADPGRGAPPGGDHLGVVEPRGVRP